MYYTSKTSNLFARISNKRSLIHQDLEWMGISCLRQECIQVHSLPIPNAHKRERNMVCQRTKGASKVSYSETLWWSTHSGPPHLSDHQRVLRKSGRITPTSQSRTSSLHHGQKWWSSIQHVKQLFLPREYLAPEGMWCTGDQRNQKLKVNNLIFQSGNFAFEFQHIFICFLIMFLFRILDYNIYSVLFVCIGGVYCWQHWTDWITELIEPLTQVINADIIIEQFLFNQIPKLKIPNSITTRWQCSSAQTPASQRSKSSEKDNNNS